MKLETHTMMETLYSCIHTSKLSNEIHLSVVPIMTCKQLVSKSHPNAGTSGEIPNLIYRHIGGILIPLTNVNPRWFYLPWSFRKYNYRFVWNLTWYAHTQMQQCQKEYPRDCMCQRNRKLATHGYAVLPLYNCCHKGAAFSVHVWYFSH